MKRCVRNGILLLCMGDDLKRQREIDRINTAMGK